MDPLLLSIFGVLSLGLTGVSVLMIGWTPALAFTAAVCVHELGHWLFWCMRSQHAAIVVSPFLGLTVPIGLQAEDNPTPFEQGILFLSGCMSSLLLAMVLWVIDLLSGHVFIGSAAFWIWFFLALVFNNIANMVLCLPIVDAGHLAMLLLPGNGYGRTLSLSILWAVAGATTFWLMSPLLAGLLIVLSFWFFFPQIMPTTESRIPVMIDGSMIRILPRTRAGSSHQTLNAVEKRILAGAWAATLCGSVALLVLHPVFRPICWETLVACFG